MIAVKANTVHCAAGSNRSIKSIPHLKERIVERGVMGTSAAAETKELFIGRLCYFHSQAAC